MRTYLTALLLTALLLPGCTRRQPSSASAPVTPSPPHPLTPSSSTPSSPQAASRPTETAAQRDARMQWWRSARFGMFIHWGVYSVPAGTYHGNRIPSIGEWIMNNGNIPVAEYAGFARQFDPEKFDADQWVQIAQNAGMKYMIITAKHHDGFAMFHTHVDGYNIYDATPFHRDPLAELAAACARHGMKLGFYYSQAQDWHHPGGVAIPRTPRTTEHWDKAQDGDFDEYLRTVAVPQVRELLTNYGPVSVLWFDTPRQMTPQRVAQFLPLLSLQPNLIVNNRLGTGFLGDTETPEQRIPPNGYAGRDWETCMTINDTWGYKSYDTNFKTTETLLHNLIDIASKGGNYLLNVGPTAEGIIPQPEVDRLQAMGAWLKTNGEAIYDTGPTPFGPEAGALDPAKLDRNGKPTFVAKWDWRCTTKPGKLYFHIFKWPAPGTSFGLPKINGTITNAYMLADPKKQGLVIMTSGSINMVALPATAPDPIASVLCVEVK